MNYRDIAKAAKDQGWRSESTKKGTNWYAPDGEGIGKSRDDEGQV